MAGVAMAVNNKRY